VYSIYRPVCDLEVVPPGQVEEQRNDVASTQPSCPLSLAVTDMTVCISAHMSSSISIV